MSATSAQEAEILLGVGSWVCCSVGMMVFNKLAVTAFPLECTLVAFQLCFTALAMVLFCWNSIHIGSAKDLMRWCIVVPFFTGMLLTSMFALSNASMTTVVTFRAISPLIALTIERFYPNPLRVTPAIVSCIALMIGGAMIYAHSMEASDRAAIGWLLLNNFFAIGDRLLQRLMLAKDQDPVDISKTGVTLINNGLATVPLAIVALLIGETKEISGALGSLSTLSWVYVLASCVVGVGISYTGIWAQSLISATSFLVLINANKFFIIFLETFVMGTKKMSPTQILGATIAILAAVAYGEARKLAENESKQTSENAKETQPLLKDTKESAGKDKV